MTITALDPRTALIVVDMQNAVLKLPYTHSIATVADHIGELADVFHGGGLPVVRTMVGGNPPGRTDVPLDRSGLTLDPGWADPVPATRPQPEDHLVTKRQWGAFTNTDLASHLTDRKVTQVVIVGVATGFGVESTARSAAELGFNVTLAVDAMTDMDAKVHHNSVERVFPKLGECGPTEEIIRRLA